MCERRGRARLENEDRRDGKGKRVFNLSSFIPRTRQACEISALLLNPHSLSEEEPQQGGKCEELVELVRP